MRNLAHSKRLTLLLFVLLVIVIALFSGRGDAQAQAPACEYIQSGNFTMLTANAPEELDFGQMAAIDSLMRNIYGDDGEMHVLGFYADNEQAQYLTASRTADQWNSWSGIGMEGVDWSWDNCQVDFESEDEIDLTVVRSTFEGATLFGLTVYEISKLSTRLDHIDIHEDTWWETAGQRAWNDGDCYGAQIVKVSCQQIQDALSNADA